MYMKTWKKALVLTLVLLFTFACMQITACAADDTVAAQAMSGSFFEFLIRLPLYLIQLLFTIIKAIPHNWGVRIAK